MPEMITFLLAPEAVIYFSLLSIKVSWRIVARVSSWENNGTHKKSWNLSKYFRVHLEPTLELCTVKLSWRNVTKTSTRDPNKSRCCLWNCVPFVVPCYVNLSMAGWWMFHRFVQQRLYEGGWNLNRSQQIDLWWKNAEIHSSEEGCPESRVQITMDKNIKEKRR